MTGTWFWKSAMFFIDEKPYFFPYSVSYSFQQSKEAYQPEPAAAASSPSHIFPRHAWPASLPAQLS
jgi:hypothetical protein